MNCLLIKHKLKQNIYYEKKVTLTRKFTCSIKYSRN